MPNLNLKDDGIEEIPEESLSPSEELGIDEPSGGVRKALPLVAGGLIALMLAGFILNRTGIIHLWGVKKASSVMVTVPQETATQTLTDSAMAAQFALDSAQITAGAALVPPAAPSQNSRAAAEAAVKAEKKKAAEAALVKKAEEKKKLAEAAAAKKQEEEKKKAEIAAAKKQADEKKKADIAEAKKKADEKKIADAADAKKKADEKKAADIAEAKKKAEEKKAADAAEAQKIAEKKKLADAEKRNFNYVEVPGYTPHRAMPVLEPKSAPRVVTPEKQAPAQREPVKREAGKTPSKKNLSAQEPTPQPAPAPKKIEKPLAAVKEPAQKTAAASVKKNRQHAATSKAPDSLEELTHRVAIAASGKKIKQHADTAKATVHAPPVAAQTPTVPVKHTAARKDTSTQKHMATRRGPAPTAVKAAVKASGDTAGTMGSGRYSVQISSWLSAAKAGTEANKYTAAGISAFVSQTGRIYRVCIGRYSSHTKALARAEELVPMLETKYDIIQVK